MTTGSHSASSMAISEANAGRDDQVQLYQLLNFPGQLPASGGGGGGATLGHLPPLVRAPAVATVASTPASEGQGRVGKAAARRRARAASRRTPTTVLSTDAVNFRAMVQQFTGAHPAPFQAGAAGGGGQAALGLGLRGAGPQLHRQGPFFPYGAQQEQQLHGSEERLPFSPGRRDHGSAAAGGERFLQGYLGKPQRGYTDVAPEGFLPEGVSPSPDQMMAPRAAASMGRWSNGANESLLWRRYMDRDP